MALPIVDEGHRPLRQFCQQITAICFSDEFLHLRRELEVYYTRCGVEHPSWTAFQDALYAILCQEEYQTAGQSLEQ